MSGVSRPVLAALSALLVAGCASGTLEERSPVPGFVSATVETGGLRATLLRALAPAGAASDVGWIELGLLVENRGDAPLVVSSVKLLTASGRYFAAAAGHGETVSPPDASTEIAGDVATHAAGAAAGQVIPYGGLVVRAIVGASEASSADARAKAEHRFRLRRIAGVELAPGGRMEGDAYFPRVPDAHSLVIEFSSQGRVQRATLPLARAGGL